MLQYNQRFGVNFITESCIFRLQNRFYCPQGFAAVSTQKKVKCSPPWWIPSTSTITKLASTQNLQFGLELEQGNFSPVPALRSGTAECDPELTAVVTSPPGTSQLWKRSGVGGANKRGAASPLTRKASGLKLKMLLNSSGWLHYLLLLLLRVFGRSGPLSLL